MTPNNFYNKLKTMIKDMPEEDRIKIFNQDGLKTLKRISECCEKSEKFAVITNDVNFQSLRALIRYFNFSVYYKRSHTTVFLTNFKGSFFSRIKDDRYRFLKAFYPNSSEYKFLCEERDKFFKNMLR